MADDKAQAGSVVRGAIVFIAEKRLRNHEHTAPVNRVVPYLFEYFRGSVSCGGDEQKLIATQPTLQDLPLGDECDFCIEVLAGIVSLFKFSEVGRRLPRQHLGRELERGGLRIEYGNFRGNIDEGSYFLVQPAQIERDLPGAGSLSDSDFHGVSTKSCEVLKELGPHIQWVESYVTDDKIYCVYIANSAEEVREHARLGGFPADSVATVRTVIDPVTAE